MKKFPGFSDNRLPSVSKRGNRDFQNCKLYSEIYNGMYIFHCYFRKKEQERMTRFYDFLTNINSKKEEKIEKEVEKP